MALCTADFYSVTMSITSEVSKFFNAWRGGAALAGTGSTCVTRLTLASRDNREGITYYAVKNSLNESYKILHTVKSTPKARKFALTETWAIILRTNFHKRC